MGGAKWWSGCGVVAMVVAVVAAAMAAVAVAVVKAETVAWVAVVALVHQTKHPTHKQSQSKRPNIRTLSQTTPNEKLTRKNPNKATRKHKYPYNEV